MASASAPGSASRYRRLLRKPQLLRLIAFGLIARLPFGMAPIALVLFLRAQTGSFATAGGVAAAFALAGGLLAPVQGRFVDRLGQTRMLVASVVVHALALGAVVALGLAHAPAALVGAFAALAGASIPPVSACFRPLLIGLVGDDEELLPTGYALDAVMMEGVFTAGPLLAAGLVAAFSPAAAVAGGALLALGGTLGFASLPASRAWRGHGTTTGIAGALASPGIRTLAAVGVPIGFGFGALEVAMPAFGADHGQASLGGVLLALLSAGSAAGGLLYGVASGRLGGVSRAYILLVSALPVAYLLLSLPGPVALMVVLVPIAGCAIAPLFAAENQLVSHVAPAGAATESYTWLIMATVVGVAAGNALGGGLVQAQGWRSAVLVGCAAAALAAAISYLRRATLQPTAVESA